MIPSPDKSLRDELQNLTRAKMAVRAARAEIRKAEAVRRRAIVKASRVGMTRRDVAKALGLTPGRVQQLLDQELKKPRRVRRKSPRKVRRID